jgi:CTP:phosphocholine cytidylyltransferase-like protein
MAEEVDYNKEYKIYNNALKLLKARGTLSDHP